MRENLRGRLLLEFNNKFSVLNKIIHFFTHFFIHTYFQKIQIMFLEQHYQMGPKSLENRKLIDKNTIVKFELFYCLMP